MTTPSPARTTVVRRIAADPTSTALLLAGPAAVDLWPGGDPVEVRATAPRRTPTTYVSRFEWSGSDLPTTTGTLTLAYAPGLDGALGTHAVLELVSAGRPDPGRLRPLADGFLDNLARAAERRSRAA